MSATITVLRPARELEELWRRHDPLAGANPAFSPAPGDRGTEIHVEVESGGILKKLSGDDPRAQAMDALRRFKALVETGEVPRSEGTPEGESVSRKLKQRPAQPLSEVSA